MVQRALIRLVLFGLLLGGSTANAQFEFDSPPISYSQSDANDKVAKLLKKIEAGEVDFQWDENRGWLPEVLRQLEVDSESQTLVFSKTSLQIRHISPRNPRAIYFNDDVYVGYVPGGDIIELSAVDPELGAVFYSLDQEKMSRPRIARDQDKCMTCHGTSKTQNVPGYLIRSVFASASGHPHYALGTQTTDHTTPLKDRFGGWFVTGEHGEMRHRGNVVARNDRRDPIDREKGANLTRLPENFRADQYMTESSDLVALMVLEHQTQMHNLMTNASYETRQALHYQKTLNQALERPADYLSDSTRRRIAAAGDKLVKYMLFSDEYSLESPIKGSQAFQETFSRTAVRDSKQRSLRDFDLQQRLFKFPCSFLIYSESFDRLPEMAKTYVLNKLAQVLSGRDQSTAFQHLSDNDRVAIKEILSETLPAFADVLNATQNQP